MKTIVFEEGLETIGRYATFTALTSLERLEIPASVKTIGDLTFGGCPALTVVIFRGDAPAEVDEYLFGYQEFNENLVIYYDPAADGWEDIVWRGHYRLEPIPAE